MRSTKNEHTTTEARGSYARSRVWKKGFARPHEAERGGRTGGAEHPLWQAYERSAGAIIFRLGEPPRREPHFLLLRYPGGYWEFARGHVEAGERELTTAAREIREETGITQLRFISGFRERYRFHFQREGRMVAKDAIIYLAEVPRWTVRTSEEHLGYVWMPYREALLALRFENSRVVLRRAVAFLLRRSRPVSQRNTRRQSA